MRVGISASTQGWNIGNYQEYNTNEQDVNYDLAYRLRDILVSNGIEAIVVNAGRGDSGYGYVKNTDWLNANGPWDCVIDLHTDAGGAIGSTVFYYEDDDSSRRLARFVYDEIAPISPDPDHGIKGGSHLYFVRATVAPAVLVETAAHDRPETAKWIIENKSAIVEAYARGIMKYLGVSSAVVVNEPTEHLPTVSELADAVMRGEYGNGSERISRLGNMYEAVQAEVNRRYGIESVHKGPDINALADAVMRGDYGNGEARKENLGALYDIVQAEVNRRYGF